MDTLADRIAAALDARGMKPADLIRQKVLSKAGVYFLLNGTTKADKVSAVTLSKLCKSLSVNWQWLLHGRGAMDGAETGPASQPARIDPHKLAVAIAALRRVAGRNGWEYDPVTHPVETVAAYEIRCLMPDAPQEGDMIDFGAKVVALFQQQDRGKDAGGDRETGAPDRRRAHK